MTVLYTLFCILAICVFYWLHIIREKKGNAIREEESTKRDDENLKKYQSKHYWQAFDEFEMKPAMDLFIEKDETVYLTIIDKKFIGRPHNLRFMPHRNLLYVFTSRQIIVLTSGEAIAWENIKKIAIDKGYVDFARIDFYPDEKSMAQMSADLSIEEAAMVVKLLDKLKIPFELLIELPAKPLEKEGELV